MYDMETGQEIGIAEDLCFKPEGEVQGIIMDRKGILQRDQIVPMSSITSIGTDGIMVGEKNAIRTKTKNDHKLHEGHYGIIGKTILTTEGEKLGIVEDVYFHEKMGTIVGYEVTDGFFADITEGRKVVHTKSPVIIGDHTIVVDLKMKEES